MKFKRILSVMLAGVIVSMTATTLSAEEDYGLNYNDTECFGSLILEKMIENAESETVSSGNVYPGNEGIAPAWAGSVHDEINDIADGFSYEIPDSMLSVVNEICRKCDSDFPAGETYGSNLHGGRNYHMSLKFLWTFAQKINTKDAISSSKVASVKQECIALFNKTKVTNAYKQGANDYDAMLKLANATQKMVNTYRTNSKFSSKNKKFIVYGMILHLLGDVTAHRTIIPKFMVTRATDSNYANSQNRFDKSDFTSVQWTRTVNAVNNGTLCFTDLHNVKESDGVTKYYTNAPLKRYEDNPKVVPNRVLQSETMIDYFCHYFSGGYSDTIFESLYNNVELIYNNLYKTAL